MNKEKKSGRIKSAVRRWLGVPISLTDGEFWAAYAGGQSAAGKSVTVDKALQLSAVWSCVRLLSETIATLPVGFYKKRLTVARMQMITRFMSSSIINPMLI
ncbi:hypothetical protein V6S19_14690 [Klebsiella pneumoniae]